jgi:hypothetical protein
MVRESKAKELAGITNHECLADLSMFSAIRKRRQNSGRRSPDRIIAGSPHTGTQRFNAYTICQNVAGLWLKYGAKSPKNAVPWASKKSG